MPFRSKRQQRFMYATKPKGVDLKEWAEKTDFDKLPEKVHKKKKSKKDKENKKDKKDKKDKNDFMPGFSDDAFVFQGDESLESHGDEDEQEECGCGQKALSYASIYHYQVKLAFDLKDLGHLALDLAGLIPVYGEAADLTNAAWYASEGRYLMAGLSLISMIPELGDAIGKGTKTLAWLAKTAPDATEFVAKHGPKIVDVIRELRSAILAAGPLIEKAFETAEKNEKLQNYIPEIREALDVFVKQDNSQDVELPNPEIPQTTLNR